MPGRPFALFRNLFLQAKGLWTGTAAPAPPPPLPVEDTPVATPPTPEGDIPVGTPAAPEDAFIGTPSAPRVLHPRRAVAKTTAPAAPRTKRLQTVKRSVNRQRGRPVAPPTLVTAAPSPVPQMTRHPAHCDKCPRKFHRRGDEVEHRKGHESIDATLPACSLCGFRCRPEGLRSHSAMHLRATPT